MLTLEPALRHQLEQCGYISLPRVHKDCPGFPGVTVLLRENAAANPFIPRSLTYRARQSSQNTEWRTLTAHTPVNTPQTLCPSHITLQDQQGHKTVFFVYGGTIQASLAPDEAVYRLQSSAPILHLSDTIPSPGDQLAAETEGLLAELEAQLNTSEAFLMAKLSELDPQHLYLWCLDTIMKRYEHNTTLRQATPGFYRALEKERDWLVDAGQWPESPLMMDEWLG